MQNTLKHYATLNDKQEVKISHNPLSRNEKSLKAKHFEASRNNVIGRRDWTRTNDPHHVKVVL